MRVNVKCKCGRTLFVLTKPDSVIENLEIKCGNRGKGCRRISLVNYNGKELTVKTVI